MSEPTGPVGRRRMLAVTLGAAAAGSLAACASETAPRVEFRSPNVSDAPSARNLRDFGAVGDGQADDTAALAAAVAVGDRPLVLYLPSGQYRVTSWPELPDYATILGDGADVTTVYYDGDGTLISLRKRQRVRFARLGFYLTGEKATAVRLSECFRCSFDSVVLRGNHLASNFPRYVDQHGVVLEHNTGGTAFINCDINNFGYGLVTSCIQNYVTASKFTNNRIGVRGTGNDHNAGLALSNVEFVSDDQAPTTDRHVVVDGAANDWWFTNVWFEGADTALSIGTAAGGPAQFGMVNCKVAARHTCLQLNRCRQPYLANVQFDPDLDNPPIEVQIDPKGCPEGTAINLISGSYDDVDARAFPEGWHVIGRGRIHGARFTGTMVVRTGAPDTDIMQVQDGSGAVLSAVLPNGTWLSDRPEGGIVLKDSGGNYWRLSVDTDGVVRTAPLGKQRPRI
ncbi:glycoside hydrolase family 55 protein [Nocardia sp. CDC159]|uniref:Glycoside hydrolase family 55 protein n=1 Tax=Nocardia pulmonis TaxID=2951408 RepID=A0A9X2E111_9NOCA|nr:MULTISPECIES: glycoside hydrolase family 55 protein [Nocardia]MCM6772169.1 glycoside hydrolase family 55 protein [Nocardia pulmonis]MCM6785173.1 glycoside hydrolase family 55 protein [Nocardia sp. CDC159]